jgi:hypothetical protein
MRLTVIGRHGPAVRRRDRHRPVNVYVKTNHLISSKAGDEWTRQTNAATVSNDIIFHRTGIASNRSIAKNQKAGNY